MQVLVVGAGVVGLAVARAAALLGHDVTVAEITGGIANGVSSRNSEVIHGGLYYPTDTLRATLCVRGRRMLYEFCASHGVGHRKCGKLVVATNEAELAKVETIMVQSQKNGVENCEMIGGNAARAMEEELFCIGALWSQETGIIDSHGYMLALWGELEDRGGMIAFETPVDSLSYKAPHWTFNSAAATPAPPSSTPWSMPRASARRDWRARSRAIRREKCRGWCSVKAIISVSPASRCSRG